MGILVILRNQWISFHVSEASKLLVLYSAKPDPPLLLNLPTLLVSVMSFSKLANLIGYEDHEDLHGS